MLMRTQNILNVLYIEQGKEGIPLPETTEIVTAIFEMRNPKEEEQKLPSRVTETAELVSSPVERAWSFEVLF